jgi:ribosomal protein S20
LGKSKDFVKEPKDGEVAKLKRHIHKLEKENNKLKSELKTYEKAFSKNITFLKEKTNDLSLEDLINGAKEDLTLKEIKKDTAYRFEDLKQRWKCFQCNEGVLRLMIIPGNRYFRKCSMCSHRTEAQDYTEEVEGIR